MEVEWWLKKVRNILRNYYNCNYVSLEAWYVDVGDFYDVEMRNRFGTTIYMDSLEKEDIDKLISALRIVCEQVYEEHGTDGSFWMKFKCIGKGEYKK